MKKTFANTSSKTVTFSHLGSPKRVTLTIPLMPGMDDSAILRAIKMKGYQGVHNLTIAE